LIAPDQPSREVKSQIFRYRRLILSLQQEAAEWTAKQQIARQELHAMETLLKSIHEAQAQFEEKDGKFVEDIAVLQRSKRKVEKEVDVLEKEKSAPYREIGRALADHGIAPLNQPEALNAVLDQRTKIAEIQAAISASLGASVAAGGRKTE
jgi:hypothetical protein